MSSHSSRHPQEVLLAQFSLHVHMFGPKLNKYEYNFYPLEVVGRGSDEKLQVGTNLNYLTQRLKG